MKQAIHVGDLITFKYHDCDYSIKPLIVKKETRRILVSHAIYKGREDKNEIKVVRRYAQRLNSKSIIIKKWRMDSLMKQVMYEGNITPYMFIEYSPRKTSLRDIKYDVLGLYCKDRKIYITYEQSRFIKRSDGELYVLLTGVRLCG